MKYLEIVIANMNSEAFKYSICLKRPAVLQRIGGKGPIRALRQSIPQLIK